MLPTMRTLRRLAVAHSMRPNYKFLSRTVHGRRTVGRQPDPPNPVSHGVENYFVDGDDTPPPSDPIYKVDATSDAAESAYDPPSGPWSRAGAGTEEYRTVSKDEPYDVPNPGSDVKLRYGGKKRYKDESGPETTNEAGQGPTGAARWGRKPEGRA